MNWADVIIYLLILWAVTGLTIIHLGVLGARWMWSGFQEKPETDANASGDQPPPDLTLAFIVPVYNEEKTIGPCLESIFNQSRPPAQVVAVDDGSTDGTAEVLREYEARGVKVVRKENGGKTSAIEAGIHEADTDLVAITDADSLVDQEYSWEILRSFRDPEVAAAGGAVESIPHTWITAARQIEYMITVNVDRAAEHHMQSVVVLPGVSTTYRRDVLLEMGFEYDTIAEDFDLTFRLHKAGYKMAMNLNAKVYTSDPPTVATYYRQLLRWYTDFWLVVKKHRDVFWRKVFGVVELPMLLLNTLAASVLFVTLPLFLLAVDPGKILHFLLIGTAIDLGLIALAHRVYGRRDVYWCLLSRYPTRFAARTAYIVAMVRVLVGKPGMAWTKLERRRTDLALEELRQRNRADAAKRAGSPLVSAEGSNR